LFSPSHKALREHVQLARPSHPICYLGDADSGSGNERYIARLSSVRQWTLGELLKRLCGVDIVHRSGPALSSLFLGRLMRKRTPDGEILQQKANLKGFDGCVGVLACLPDGQVEWVLVGAVPVVHRGDDREQE